MQRARTADKGFFEHVRIAGSRGFLVTKRVADCDAATSLGIACAVSNEETRRGCIGQRSPLSICGYGRKFDADIMMSQEKWLVVETFLAAGRRILFAGADVRLLRPVRALFAVAPEADAIFEGNARREGVVDFTPDIFGFAPRRDALAFCVAVREALHAFSHPLLTESVGNLLGPADQDLLFDVLRSTLYDFPLPVQTGAAANILAGRRAYTELWERWRVNASARGVGPREFVPPRRDAVPWHSQPEINQVRRVAKRANDWLQRRFGLLNVSSPREGGHLVTSPRLTALFSQHVLFWSAPSGGSVAACERVCPPVDGHLATRPHAYPHYYAVHCLGKKAGCLELRQRCGCDAHAKQTGG